MLAPQRRGQETQAGAISGVQGKLNQEMYGIKVFRKLYKIFRIWTITGVISKDAIYLYYLIENDKIINFFPISQ